VLQPSIEWARPVSFTRTEPEGSSQVAGKRDFLRSGARTPLCGKFQAAGILFTITTNFEPILEIAHSCFERVGEHNPDLEVHLRFWVDASLRSSLAWPKPYFRGIGHLVFAGFDSQNSLLIDLHDHTVLGRLTPELAADQALWKTVIYPVLLATLGAAAGMAVLHCGCVAWRETGLLLAGDSGSGKSTLSLALAQTGFGFISDDRTILRLAGGRLTASGLGPCLKLRPEAAVHFSGLEAPISANFRHRAADVYLNPFTQLGLERVYACEPRWLFFLEQNTGAAFSVEEISPRETSMLLESGLHRESAEAVHAQKQVIRSVSQLECYVLRLGGSPHAIAWALRGFLADRLERKRPRLPAVQANRVLPEIPRRDPLRRFTPTPFTADFRMMGRHVRLESNSNLLLDCARRALGKRNRAVSAIPDFTWRILSDSSAQLQPPWPELTAFSNDHLRFINIGQRSFVAVHLERREGVAFISESLAADEAGFVSIVLASLSYLSAGALGLTAVSAACIASAEKGLLIFGVPHSGKTTSCYVARGQGYRFHADQACFFEMEGGALRAWGDFWPAAFHLEASKFFPELIERGRPFTHRNASYLCLEKNPHSHEEPSQVVPVACIFLEREAADPPRLISLSPRDLARMLEQGIPFQDDSGPEEARRAVFSALGKLPAYRLLYGNNPSVPSLFFRSLLSSHQFVECLG
jgi:hypothetical protein